MSLAKNIRADARAIRTEQPGIGVGELRDRLRAIYVFRTPWGRLGHSASVWTERAGGNLSAFLLALLVVAPAAAVWDAAFGPWPDAIERLIDDAINDGDGSGIAAPAALDPPPSKPH